MTGSAGYISMENGSARGFVQRAVNSAFDELSVVEMGGRGIASDQTRVTYATSRAMPRDRVRSLREANVYEARCYRHVIGPHLIEPAEGDSVRARTNFIVVRIMHTGEMMIFASGHYDDRVVFDDALGLRFSEKVVVLDSRQVDALLVIPI